MLYLCYYYVFIHLSRNVEYVDCVKQKHHLLLLLNHFLSSSFPFEPQTKTSVCLCPVCVAPPAARTWRAPSCASASELDKSLTPPPNGVWTPSCQVPAALR